MSVLYILTTSPIPYGVLIVGRIGHRDKRLPPGPPTLPVNEEMGGDEYGGIFSLKLANATMVVLNDRVAIQELTETRGALYSDRPLDEMVSIAGQHNFAFWDAHALWRSERKVAAAALSPSQLDGELCWMVQEAEVAMFIQDLLTTPDQFFFHVKRTVASIANILVWGFRAPSYEDWWGHTVHDVSYLLFKFLEPGSYPPRRPASILEIPSGSIEPLESPRVSDRRRKGDKRSSLADRLPDGTQPMDVPLDTEMENCFLGILVEGGAEMTASSLETAFLFLAVHPEVQAKARREIDRVCGPDNETHHYGYGGGRRVCPGIHVGERSLWRMIATALWAFEIGPKTDPLTGEVKRLDTSAYVETLNHHPEPYEVDLKLRSDGHGKTIRREAARAAEFLRRFAE
ncbi:hypothetical protein LV164_002689 [Aspergillus fumigatus]|nr:hypothetical protein KXW62_003506 [Aspergillus fumigatus]KAJ8180515.1 hypothetical protein LV157_006956 [Aspergillus fumigatus]KAJ8211912.1 hypothetical protein LV164_002689 [Aspergillus fumigatus]